MRWFKLPLGPDRRLGPLETEMLDILWQNGKITVREMHERYRDRLAYTTVMTTLDRLYKKGLLSREKSGRAFVYDVKVTRPEFGEMMARQAVHVMLDYAEPSPSAVLSYFVNAIGESDERLLDELERAVKNRRERDRK